MNERSQEEMSSKQTEGGGRKIEKGKKMELNEERREIKRVKEE